MMKHFKLDGQIEDITKQEAGKRMSKISSQWEKETTNRGKLHMGVYDWDFTSTKFGMTINIPKLRTGGEIQKNQSASDFFGFDIYGDCFLEN